MKELIRRGLRRFGLEIRRVPPHRHAPYVEDIGLPHVLDVLFRRADDLTFVQVGANDGVCNDLLVSCLATSNPKGILIEPQAEPFRKLQERYGDRERLVVVRGAIDQQRGTRTLYRCRDDLAAGDRAAFLSGLASFDRCQVAASYRRHARRLGLDCPAESAIVAEEVPTFTLESVLRQHGYERCDLLMLDAEGYDFEIIRALDFSRIKPAVLIYEHMHLRRPDRLACWSMLRTHGYRCAAGWSDTLALLTEAPASRPAARVSHRPNEPERGAPRRLEPAPPDPPVPVRTPHEPAAPWLPNEPGPGGPDDPAPFVNRSVGRPGRIAGGARTPAARADP